jgi:hypothetical protein
MKKRQWRTVLAWGGFVDDKLDSGFRIGARPEMTTVNFVLWHLLTLLFCEKETPVKDWKKDKCPKCGRAYNVLLAQDSEE